MKEYTINVYNVNTLETIDTFVAEFENVGDLCDFMDTELHNYDDKYTNLNYRYTTLDYKMDNKNTPKHYQGTIQPIDLINAQNLNFNLGIFLIYVCRAGKKQGENVFHFYFTCYFKKTLTIFVMKALLKSCYIDNYVKSL